MQYIGVDWGTSNFRAYLLSEKGKICDKKNTNTGLKDLKKDEFEDYLLSQISPWLQDSHKPIILCGMVGSQAGWHEVPYIHIKDIMTALPTSVHKIATKNQSLEAYIMSGACQKPPQQMDVMRGEETQVFGFLNQNKNFSGYIILPGTHSKWVEVNKGEVVGFRTFMTGELYQIIKQYSILSSLITDEIFNEKDFQDGLNNSITDSQFLTNYLFSLRATSLLMPETSRSISSYLSGLLVGLEIASFKDILMQKPEITIIGSTTLMEIYQKAVSTLDLYANCYNSEKATTAGLLACIKACKQVKGN